MSARRTAKTLRWLNKHIGRLAGEPILAGDGFVPEGGHVQRSAGVMAATVVSPLGGVAASVRQGHKQRDAAIAASQLAAHKAGALRFPNTAVYVVATASRLVVADIHHVTGRPSRVVTEYGLDEVDSIVRLKGSVAHRRSELRFVDGSVVTLNSPRGGGYYPQDTVPLMAAAITTFHSKR